MTTELPSIKALLVLPRLRVQNANAISSPMTWGFPAITAFTGLMIALERRLGHDSGIKFYSVGVICHSFEPQVTRRGYTRSFHLMRNPVLHDGSTAPIVEEGRAHLNITLVFEVELTSALLDEVKRNRLATNIDEVIASMRVAGGIILPRISSRFHPSPRPQLLLMAEDKEVLRKNLRKLSRQWLPGFALVSRDDLLQERQTELQAVMPNATLLDAWLDLSRLNHRAVRKTTMDNDSGTTLESVEWVADHRPGWIVPIPVGYAALSELHAAGTVARARDPSLPFCFVESVYSLGQWISPHRLTNIHDLMWEPFHDPSSGLYRCTNNFSAQFTPVSNSGIN